MSATAVFLRIDIRDVSSVGWGGGVRGRGERVVLDNMFTSSLKSFNFSLWGKCH